MKQAVFLSYASQDAEAARKICQELRAAGIEVWFDQNELRGGDAWDAKIRRQIRECALFVPVISAQTQVRPEGYFRLEWKLAVDRSHLMADDQPFLVPVTIDEVAEVTARVPDRFREVQWTRLGTDGAFAGFAMRVRRLLEGAPAEGVPAPAVQGSGEDLTGYFRETADAAREGYAGWTKRSRAAYRRLSRPARFTLSLLLLAAGYGIGLSIARWRKSGPEPAAERPAEAPRSDALQLVDRARAIFDRGDLTREDLRTAEELCDRAIAIDPTEAEAWAARAQVHAWFVFYRYDTGEPRKAKANADAARAMNLNPRSYEARLAHAAVLTKVIALPATRDEAEQVLLTLAKERPADARVLDHLGLVLRAQGKTEEAAAYFLRANNPGGAAWTYFEASDFARAMEAVERALQQDESVSALILKAALEYRWREDLDAAKATIERLPGSALRDDSYAMTSITIALYRRETEQALELLRSLPGDYLSALGYVGPKAALMAMAHEIAGRPEAARAEWRGALRTVEAKLQERTNDPHLLWWKASALVGLGDLKAADEQLRLALQLAGASPDYVGDDIAGVLIRLGRGDAVLEWLEKLFEERPPGWEQFHSAARFHRDFDPLRGTPRFEALLRGNLPPGAKAFE